MRDLMLRHKIFFGAIVLLMLLVIPLTVFQVQQQQELRQRAEGGEVTLSLSSLTEPKYPNDIFYINVALENLSGRDISAVEFTLSSNNNNIKIVEFKPSSYQGYTNETTDSSLQFTGLNTGESEIRSESIPLGKLTLQALATGDSKLSFSNITVTASLSPDPLSTSSQDGSYSIPAQTASTPAANCGGIECPSGFSCDRSNPSDPSCVSSTPSSTITPAATATPTPTPNCAQKCTNQRTGGFDLTCYNQCTQALTPTPAPPTPTPIPTPIVCGPNVCNPGQSCKPDPADGELTCVDNPTPTPTPTPVPTAIVCPPKSNGNADNSACSINDEDYGIWKAEFLSQTGTRADFDGDGKVTILDFNIWYQFRGT